MYFRKSTTISKILKIKIHSASNFRNKYSFFKALASHADVLRGSSRIPAPQTSAELKGKFLSHCSQISAGDHIQIIKDPIGTVKVKVGYLVRLNKRQNFFHTLLFCSKADFHSANLNPAVIFFNEILRVAISTNACE